MKALNGMLLAIGLGVSLGFAISALADESKGNMESLRQDKTATYENIQKVRKKEYPNGADESDLKVQTALVAPARKLAPVTELKTEEASEE